MSTDPMLDDSLSYSINRFSGNGVTTNWEINFAGGYIRREHVKAYTTHNDVNTIITLAWIGPNTVQVTPAVPTGTQLTVYRDTPKAAPEVDFINGSIINEPNLDTLSKQAVFVSAEMLDRFGVVASTSETALTQSNFAIETAEALTGGDFTQFVLLSNLTWSAVSGKPTTFTPSAHTHIISEVTGLQAALDDKATDAELTAGLAIKANTSTVASDIASAVLVETNARKATDNFLFVWASR